MNFRIKLILIFFLVIAITSIAASSIYYYNSVNIIEENYKNLVRENVSNEVEQFDEMMKGIYYTVLEISLDEQLVNLIKNSDQDEETLLNISLLLHEYQLQNEKIDSIYVYLKNIDYVAKSEEYKAAKSEISARDIQWLQAIQDRTMTIYPVFLLDTIGAVPKRTISYSVPIIDKESGDILGEVCVNVDERVVFYTYLETLRRTDEYSTEIIDENNRVISAEDINHLNEIENGQADLILYSSFTNYRFASDINSAEVTATIADIRNKMILTAIIAVISAVFIGGMLTNKMYSRIYNLKLAMEHFSNGELSTRAKVKSYDEIGELSVGFNSMAGRVEDLIEELVSERYLKEKAELEALEYQITPHFMYNTLNSIRFAAFLKGEKETSELLYAFINLLQSSISKKGEIISLQDELTLVKNYVLLQQFRHKDNFEVEYHIDESVLNCVVPRLILQPLVENAIFHGLDIKAGKNKISITIEKNEDRLQLVVEDNGIGMTREEVENIFNSQKGEKEKFNRIGIPNIKQRIKLYYEDMGDMIYESEKGKGVKVKILIPITVSIGSKSLEKGVKYE